MWSYDAHTAWQRELLARLDRIATVDRGHRAGLHLYDPLLFEQYSRVLSAWKEELLVARDASDTLAIPKALNNAPYRERMSRTGTGS